MAEGGMDLGLTIHGGSSYDENLQNTCKNCKHLDQFLAAAREYINKLEGDIERLREELSTYSKKNPDLHYERIDSERAKRRLQEKNTELESLLDNAKQESRKRKEDYQQAAAKVRYLEKIMQTHGPKSDHGKALQNENEQLKASLKTVKDSHAEAEEQIRNLLKENAVITDKNRENEQIKGKLEYCNKTLKVHLEKENTRAEELIKEHLKLKNEWKIILEGKEGEIDEINEKLNAKESDILVLNKSLDGKEERLKELQGMNSYLKETKEDLERELDSKCVALKKCEETYERDNRGFQTEAQKFRADISSLKKELHCEKINNKSHKSELERQNSLLDAKNAEIDSLTGKLQTEKKLVSEKNEALNNEKQSLDDAKKTVKRPRRQNATPTNSSEPFKRRKCCSSIKIIKNRRPKQKSTAGNN